ncbi:hypothetical protein [Membranihabitans maritimus]|uniref:hypothetical protein n=1 Tax=Membranihabitans maritimus TaxID=2904244 RepID=UPI001F3E0779|nr:hypothetical protein [Membranihabitans maritimus]
MPISNSEQLFSLVKSMNKSEKRSFKLFAQRSHNKGVSKFIQLYDILDNLEHYDEQVIMNKAKGIGKSQLSNLKRHLYTQILSSLRNIYISKELDIEIREQLDFARILYAKGLYMQSLKILERVKGIAKESHQDVLHFEILEFEKRIEEKHITRSRGIKGKIEGLIEESDETNKVISSLSGLTNLKLKIHGLYIKGGHARNRDEGQAVLDYFEENLPVLEYENLSFFEKVYLHQSYVWLHYILLDFENCLEHATKWVEMFEEFNNMQSVNPDLFMRGMHYKMTAQFHLNRVVEYEKSLDQFDLFYQREKENFNKTSEIIYFLYNYYAKLDFANLNGRFDKSISLKREIEVKLDEYERHIDNHRVLQFYYKFAWTHFARQEFGDAIKYLNKILSLNVKHLREDIQCYSWLLFILSHFEQENFALLTHLIKSASNFFEKMKEKNKVQEILMKFVRTRLRPNHSMTRKAYKELIEDLEHYTKDTYQGKALLYLDAKIWAESKLTGTSIEIIKRRNAGSTFI